MPEGDIRKKKGVEIKYSIHGEGETLGRAQPNVDERTTFALLVKGEVDFEFNENGRAYHVPLKEQGDYVMWEGIPHRWSAKPGSVTLTIRWSPR